MYYLDIWNTNVETTFSFSLYTMLLLFALVVYFRKATQGDLWRTNSLELLQNELLTYL